MGPLGQGWPCDDDALFSTLTWISRGLEFFSWEKQRTWQLIETEVNSVRLEVEHLRSALEAAEIRYNEEQAGNAEQTEKAYGMVEPIKSASTEKIGA